MLRVINFLQRAHIKIKLRRKKRRRVINFLQRATQFKPKSCLPFGLIKLIIFKKKGKTRVIYTLIITIKIMKFGLEICVGGGCHLDESNVKSVQQFVVFIIRIELVVPISAEGLGWVRVLIIITFVKPFFIRERGRE